MPSIHMDVFKIIYTAFGGLALFFMDCMYFSINSGFLKTGKRERSKSIWRRMKRNLRIRQKEIRFEARRIKQDYRSRTY